MNISRSLAALSFAALIGAPAVASAQYSENFDTPPSGWTGSSNACGYDVTSGSAYVCGSSTLTSPSFTLTGGGTLAFDWFFWANDGGYYNDYGYVNLFDGTNNTTLVFADNNSNGTGGGSFFGPLAAGTYTLTVGVQNVGDNIVDSAMNIDNINAVAAVPEPASLVLMGTGLIGVLGAAVRRRKVA